MASTTSLSGTIRAYSRFIPSQILRLMGTSDITRVKLGDQIEMKMTILFSDIRNFTSISENMLPQENFNFLNSYFQIMEPVIRENHGIVDKYVGDAIMALFPESADDAVKASLAILDKLREYNRVRRQIGLEPIKIGIGLNSGIVMLGTVGADRHMEYTAVGDPVNLSSRVQTMTKEYGVQLLISEHTYSSLNNPRKYDIRFLDRINPRGYAHPVSVYEVFDSDSPPVRSGKSKSRRLFEEAIANYHYGHISIARRLFLRMKKSAPQDHPVQIYLDRCSLYSASGIHERANELNHQIGWHPSYRTGDPKIDAQHRCLILHMANLVRAIKSRKSNMSIDKTLKFLREYAFQHFSDEEKFLARYAYPLLGVQKQQHANFLRELDLLAAEIEAQEAVKTTYLLFRVHVFVVDWILNHFLKEDMHYSRTLKIKSNPLDIKIKIRFP